MASNHKPENISDEFALDKEMEEFEFCSEDEIRGSKRFRLLHLRDQEVPEFRSLRMIPASEELISTDTFEVSTNPSKLQLPALEFLMEPLSSTYYVFRPTKVA
jgi:hypothetical protein